MDLHITRAEYRSDPRRFYDAVLADPQLRVVVDCDVCPFEFASCPPGRRGRRRADRRVDARDGARGM